MQPETAIEMNDQATAKLKAFVEEPMSEPPKPAQPSDASAEQDV